MTLQVTLQDQRFKCIRIHRVLEIPVGMVPVLFGIAYCRVRALQQRHTS
jgi:hypothetical protein